MKIIGIIPARFDSTRFPGKPLVSILGKPMIQRVYEQALKATLLNDVIVATDSTKIEKAIKDIGGKVEMTDKNHQNGTERCGEIAQKYEADYFINIQGDEPFIHPEQIDTLAAILNGKTEIATLVKKIEEAPTLFQTSIMKVVFDRHKNALYFSRNCIPFLRDKKESEWLQYHDFYKHIGIYAYRNDILGEITQLPKGNLEKAENLEQLRWLENGYKIKIAITQYESIGIDTPEDVKKVL